MDAAISMASMASSTQPINADAAWAAVEKRDVQADGRFVYAVSSTGVYCRPSCPSRRPARRHVEFYAKPLEAESAGYRACLRCRPTQEDAPPAAAVKRAREYLDRHSGEPVTLAQLAQYAGLSSFHLQRTFKRLIGMTPREYADAIRAEQLKSHLRQSSSVTAAIFEAGYGSSRGGYQASAARLGMTPGTYRRGGRGMRIRYATAPTAVGRVLVAATERGICSVKLADVDAELVEGLHREYPEAEIRRAPGELRHFVDAVVRQINGSGEQAVPLDPPGSLFQWRVWKALLEIPRGTTRSYGQIAADIGAPSATRAVARACAQNRVAVLIPCHRVVRSDGNLGGYRWGTERKRRLLSAERREEATAGE